MNKKYKYKDRQAEYMREYRKSRRKVVADVLIEEKEQLDEIINAKGITMADWVRQHIQEDYKQIKK